MPSTEKNNFLLENIVVKLNSKELRINIYDTPLGKRFLEALKDNLKQNEVPAYANNIGSLSCL